MQDKYKQFDKYQGKKKNHADLYEQFIDKDRAKSYEYQKLKEEVQKHSPPKPPRWTPEDQALEDILWAS